mmetsp:Transcript_34832/g.58516  ORF Transcript_34832/g.58516 Transcript_34832/m.58516 type:complete len:261 (-) Transcript_34832:441-1223(-)
MKLVHLCLPHGVEVLQHVVPGAPNYLVPGHDTLDLRSLVFPHTVHLYSRLRVHCVRELRPLDVGAEGREVRPLGVIEAAVQGSDLNVEIAGVEARGADADDLLHLPVVRRLHRPQHLERALLLVPCGVVGAILRVEPHHDLVVRHQVQLRLELLHILILWGQVALERESALVAGAQFRHEVCKVLQPRGPGACRTLEVHSQRLRMRREDGPRQTDRQLGGDGVANLLVLLIDRAHQLKPVREALNPHLLSHRQDLILVRL